MIAKQVRAPSAGKHEFARLVKYLIDGQDKLQRVGEVRVTNCYSGDVRFAVLETLNTQARNTRAGPDRTYQILSFRAGEEVDRETLALIEERVCNALGFADHQRVSVVHHDTDNLHVHIAINKIHPTRYTIHNPYRDFHTLAQVCEQIEADYQLEKDNHQARKCGAENRAADMESHAGVESLLGWIRGECGDQIRAAKSWGELHAVLRDQGLELRQRANGLVFADGSGVMVKASAVDRAFSQPKMEARLGEFVARPEGREGRAPRKAYAKRPVRCGINTAELFAKYQREQAQNSHTCAAANAQARDRKSRLIEAAKQRGRLKRSAIKLMDTSRIAKKLMYRATGTTLVGQIAAINKAYLKERQANYDRHRRRSWAAWLRARAVDGDMDALHVLRAGNASRAAKGNAFSGDRKPVWSAHAARRDGVTKKGSIIYSCGATAVRDDGQSLAVSGCADQEGLRAALAIAQERFGSRIAVHGSDSFREQIALAAASGKLDITFDDKALELRRSTIIRENIAQARSETRRQRNATSGVAHCREPTRNTKSLPPEIGTTTDTERPAQSAMQDLADQRRTAFVAAKYVHDRDQRRTTTVDKSRHDASTYSDRSAVTYGGMRIVDGQTSALLLQDGEVKVVPINRTIARRLKDLKIGTAIDVWRAGIVKTSGRSR